VSTEALTDSVLVQRAAQGCEHSFSLLLQRHRTTVYRTLLSKIKDRDWADDLYQEVWIKVLHTLRDGRYKDEGKFGGWLTRVTQNAVTDAFRRAKKSSSESLEDESPLLADAVRWMHALPREQYEVVHLRIYANLTFQEIADETGVSINTALGRMRYALINMRKQMAAEAAVA
jgi:RNA polymerase sigma factor (sigma-70 family)